MIPEHPLAYEHIRSEKEFKMLCEENGLTLVDLAYHHTLSDDTVKALQKDSSPASLLFRTSPDFLLFNGDRGVYVELKTGRSKDKIFFEAFPLMCNQIKETSLHAPCIYVYRGPITDFNMFVCPVRDISPETLVVPKKKGNEKISDIITKYFDCPYKEKEVSPYFSGDAYVELKSSQVSEWTPVEKWILGNKKGRA